MFGWIAEGASSGREDAPASQPLNVMGKKLQVGSEGNGAGPRVGGFLGRKEGIRGCIEVMAGVILPLNPELLPLFTLGKSS